MDPVATRPRIGTAGWTIPARDSAAFPSPGSGLERYAACFGCAEINSSFHRSHRPETWRRWAEVGSGRISASPPSCRRRSPTSAGSSIARSRSPRRWLRWRSSGERLEVLLVQLPPSLAFEPAAAQAFFAELRGRFDRLVACEPRHSSWFEGEADALLGGLRVARVAADPARVPAAAEPGGWRGLAYYRLHGSPSVYRSSYDDGRLEGYAARIAAEGGPAWCIFDNTASGAATADALKLKRLLSLSL